MKIGDVVDSRFEITKSCSTSGGMGNVVFVTDRNNTTSTQLVLKYCKSFDPKLIRRFKREVALLNDFRGNSKVVQIIAHNTEHNPPYYVMPYYADGDLSRRQAALKSDPALQEQTLCDAIDCIAELHTRGVFHRDIKPQNFLQNGNDIVVSDMGLSVEVDSTATTITSTAEAWGTFGYAPPEFRSDGFRNPDAPGDIFMLGKTFYQLLSGRDPVYMTPTGIAPGLFHVLKRACDPTKEARYQTLADFKQAIVSAFDIVLNRVQGANNCRSKLATIESRLSSERSYDVDEINDFVNSLFALDDDEQDQICQQLNADFFRVVAQSPFDTLRSSFLDVYGKMVRKGNYGWAFAEHIADCIEQFFNSPSVPNDQKAGALRLAIHAAYTENRFNAMGTCNSLVTEIVDNDLAEHVRPILLDFPDSFLTSIEPVNCKNDIISKTINGMAVASEEKRG
ncbi:serine/threonine protein kinase [Planctomycetaceae bacterium SH139]